MPFSSEVTAATTPTRSRGCPSPPAPALCHRLESAHSDFFTHPFCTAVVHRLKRPARKPLIIGLRPQARVLPLLSAEVRPPLGRSGAKGGAVEIRLVSSLTSDDELRMAPAVLEAIGGFLDNLPIAYTLRIKTANGRGFSHYHLPVPAAERPSSADNLSLEGVPADTLA